MANWNWHCAVGGWEAVRGSVTLRVGHDTYSDMWRATARLPQRDHWAPIGEYDGIEQARQEAEKAVPRLLLAEHAASAAELRIHGVEIPDGKD